MHLNKIILIGPPLSGKKSLLKRLTEEGHYQGEAINTDNEVKSFLNSTCIDNEQVRSILEAYAQDPNKPLEDKITGIELLDVWIHQFADTCPLGRNAFFNALLRQDVEGSQVYPKHSIAIMTAFEQNETAWRELEANIAAQCIEASPDRCFFLGGHQAITPQVLTACKKHGFSYVYLEVAFQELLERGRNDDCWMLYSNLKLKGDDGWESELTKICLTRHKTYQLAAEQTGGCMIKVTEDMRVSDVAKAVIQARETLAVQKIVTMATAPSTAHLLCYERMPPLDDSASASSSASYSAAVPAATTLKDVRRKHS